jgi:hypothetical protein
MSKDNFPSLDKEPGRWFMETFRLTWGTVPVHLAFILSIALLIYANDDFGLKVTGVYISYIILVLIREAVAWRQKRASPR